MNDQRKDYLDPKRLLKRNCPQQLQTPNVPTDNMENTDSPNKGGNLLVAYKSLTVPRGIERMQQMDQ